MRKELASYALALAVGAGGAALIVPAASYATTGDSTRLSGRVTAVQNALKGLVGDGTLSQEQADEVAATLAKTRPERPSRGGRGHLPVDRAVAAEALGITTDELRAAGRAGKTLATLAQDKDVSRDELVEALFATSDRRLSAAVAAGTLTQAQADDQSARAKERVLATLDKPLRAKGGPGGGDRRGGPPGGTATPSPDTTTD